MPAATVVIPTYSRPRQLAEAVASALDQRGVDHEVLVVDDGSAEPVRLPFDPRLRVVRLPANRGPCAARNVGLAEAVGRWITYLDDDDLLLPHHLEAALEAVGDSDLPEPVATLSGTASLAPGGEVTMTRLPPTLPRGAAFALEEPVPGRSFATKCTLVVERAVLQDAGGWDETFRSRNQTELFLRLNPVCSLLGIPVVTYHRRTHPGPRVSDDPRRRVESLRQLEAKHHDLFAARPGRHAELVFAQAWKLWLAGRRLPAVGLWARAVRLHPRRAGQKTAEAARLSWHHTRLGQTSGAT